MRETERTPPGPAVPGRALVPFTAAAARTPRWPSLSHSIIVGVLGVALGAGVVAASGGRHAVAAWLGSGRSDAQTAALHRLQGEVSRLEALRTSAEAAKPDEPLRSLRHSVDALKQDVEQVRASDTQLTARIDKADHESSPKLAEIAARIDRMEHAALLAKAQEAPAPKVADLAGRVDRIEKQVANPAPTGSIPAAAPLPSPPIVQAIPGRPAAPPVTVAKAETTTVPPTPPAKPASLARWVLRDVYDGVALVEARGGGMREVSPGEYLPGAGEIRSIERRGRGWVVLTSRGQIDDTTF